MRHVHLHRSSHFVHLGCHVWNIVSLLASQRNPQTLMVDLLDLWFYGLAPSSSEVKKALCHYSVLHSAEHDYKHLYIFC
jgi:dihydroneopterin aldolase